MFSIKLFTLSNLLLTKLSFDALQDFLHSIEDYKLEFRESLGIDSHITYGLEIECDKLSKKQEAKFLNMENNKFLNDKGKWLVKEDSSVPMGGEIISPILKDDNYCWRQVKEICEYLKKHSKIKGYAAGHIHIGANILNEEAQKLYHFLCLWMVYENIIFRFCYGEYLTPRKKIMEFAMPIADLLGSEYDLYYEMMQKDESIKDLFREIYKLLHNNSNRKIYRNEAVNFTNLYDFHTVGEMNTIEFRCPNGTTNPVIWQNNVNLFANILTNGVGNLYQEDIVLKRKELNGRSYKDISSYNEIYLEQALEFCDLVFLHNIDKVYFLKQYLKNYETSSLTLKRAHSFTK